MKVLIAPDKFKGSLTSFEVCNAIAAGINQADKTIEVFSFPMADGGDGFSSVMQYYLPAESVACIAADPLGRGFSTSYQWESDTQTAIIEMASSSGLVLLKETERNPLVTSSYGTGLLIKNAISKGAKKIILGVGGSATNDAGTGVLEALGFQFADAAGNWIKACGKNLALIDQIIPPVTIPDIYFEIACDVQNLLYGPQGAAFVYAPQKGASGSDVPLLDNGLKHFAQTVKHQTGKDIAVIPGTGAAGGVPAGLMAFFEVTIKSGIELVMTASGIKNKIAEADLLITGEGKIDRQTLDGKVVSKLAGLAHQYQIPAIAFCGVMDADDRVVRKLNLQAVECLSSSSISITEAIANAKQLLTERSSEYFKRVGRL
jgi:glycerate kinase